MINLKPLQAQLLPGYAKCCNHCPEPVQHILLSPTLTFFQLLQNSGSLILILRVKSLSERVCQLQNSRRKLQKVQQY